jgi:hypothetical protein
VAASRGSIGTMRGRHSVGRCVAALSLWTQLGWAQVDVPLADAPSQPPAAEAPAPHHPEPRVVVNVTSVKGPHARGDIERAARLAWGRIVSCYKAIDPRAKGLIRLELAVAGHGEVTDARRTHSTLKNRELAACLTGAMKGLAMPKARAGSTAHTEIQVAPGDPPRTEGVRGAPVVVPKATA